LSSKIIHLNFPDLSPGSYFGAEEAPKLVSVGWLDGKYTIPNGESDELFMRKLIDVLVNPWALMHLLGFAECPFCTLDSHGITHKDKKIVVGALNLFVPDEGLLYVMPSLAAHYILTHGYRPPAVFCEAVLQCPPMSSRAYFEAIVANGPPRFAGMVKKKHLAEST
jgi:hypothetical protein